jgi:hypothetical protein
MGKDEDQKPLPGFHIGPDAAMFGVDYPHFESFVPNTFEKVAILAGHPSVTTEDTSKVLFDNAARFYGFDVDGLKPHIDRIGFELADILAGAGAGADAAAGV